MAKNIMMSASRRTLFGSFEFGVSRQIGKVNKSIKIQIGEFGWRNQADGSIGIARNVSGIKEKSGYKSGLGDEFPCANKNQFTVRLCAPQEIGFYARIPATSIRNCFMFAIR